MLRLINACSYQSSLSGCRRLRVFFLGTSLRSKYEVQRANFLMIDEIDYIVE